MADNADPAGELTQLLDDDVVDIEDRGAECSADGADAEPRRSAHEPISAARRAMMLALPVAVALAVFVGWVGFCEHPSGQAHAQRRQFFPAAPPCALNPTTIDWRKAENDVKR